MGAEDKYSVERKKVEIEQVSITNLTLRDLLRKELVEEFDKLGKELNKEIIPLGIIAVAEPNDKKGEIDSIFLGPLTKEGVTEKKISIQVQNQELLNRIIAILKKL